jgi:hypothetical protein
MPLPAEVHALDTQVGGDQGFVPGGDSEDGAIVAYAKADG